MPTHIQMPRNKKKNLNRIYKIKKEIIEIGSDSPKEKKFRQGIHHYLWKVRFICQESLV